jgi:hypothetical protein
MLPFVVAAHVRIEQRWRWALFVVIATLLAISPYHMLLWFYSGYFLAKEIGALLAGRRWLAATTFVVGLIGLETAGTNSEFYAVGIVIPSAMSAALMIGAVAASRELLQWTTVAPLRFLGRISYSLYLVHWPIFYVCALLAVICRPAVPTHIWGNLLVMVTSAIVAVGVAAVDQGGQVGGARPAAYPGAEMDEDLATASRGELKRRPGLAGRARPLSASATLRRRSSRRLRKPAATCGRMGEQNLRFLRSNRD